MTDPQFSRPGAVDLSSLVPPTSSPSAPTGAPAGASWVMQVTETSFENVVQLSMRHPVVLELWSPRAQGADQLSADLVALTNAAQGRWLLGRVNVDTDGRIAQALQVQAVPTVVAVIGGQLAPLFQGTQPKEQIAAALDQVVQAAAASGIVGRAEPVDGGPAAPNTDEAPAADPRFAAADEALAAGDYQKALDEFDTLLAATPNDPEVIAGRAQTSLLLRAQAAEQASSEPVDEIDATLATADRAVLTGDLEGGFNQLLDVIREHDGDVRERARVRLLELFAVVGNADPAVLKARRALSTALF